MECRPRLARTSEALLALAFALAACRTTPEPRTRADSPAPPPNVILIFVDDLGWTDLGVAGSDLYQTPHIDRLAAEGMRFTDAYAAAPICSPSRAAILTGQSPARLHLTDWIPGHKRPHARLAVPDWTMYLDPAHTTIAERLKAKGYATASIGKWHLGGEAYRPEVHGFDVNLGGDHMGHPDSYFSPHGISSLPDGPAGEYLTDREAEEATRFIEANAGRPFFLYLPHHAVHTPIQAKADMIDAWKPRATEGKVHDVAEYAAMLESVDQSVGRLLATLDRLGLRDRTLVIFTSDNGGLASGGDWPTSNVPLRAGKGTAYEGGVRVPLIVRWPGITQPGTVSREPVVTMDVHDTIVEATLGSIPAGAKTDGMSLLPLLRGVRQALGRDALYWHYPHYHNQGATPFGAIRAGNLRLVEFFEDGRLELFDLDKDIGERVDLAPQRPDDVARLHGLLKRWRDRVGAQMPRANPAHDADKDAAQKPRHKSR